MRFRCSVNTGTALRQSCLVLAKLFSGLVFGDAHAANEVIGAQGLGSAGYFTDGRAQVYELSTPDDYTILGVVISEDVISRQATFLHNPERVLHMLRNRTLGKEQHKAALVGLLCSGRWYLQRGPETLYYLRCVGLSDNLLLAIGDAGRGEADS